MKKILLCVNAIVLSHAFSQTSFSNATNLTDGAYNSSVSFLDADGDGDKDFIYCGANTAVGTFTKLMINDGLGNFTTSSQVFPQVWIGSVVSGDIDGDNDVDIYITGSNSTADLSLNGLFFNDGNGVFTIDSSSIIEAHALGDVALFDCDGDGDLDILSTGGDLSSQIASTKLYLNDGSGNFTMSTENLGGVSFAFATMQTGDVDADGDKDLVIIGQSYLNSVPAEIISSLYLNNGQGTFSLSPQSLIGVAGGDVELGDIDNDNDLDIILSGTDSAEVDQFQIYKNSGLGVFTPDNSSVIDSLFSPSIELFDADNDNDLELLYTGGPLENMQLKYYNNNGGVFSEILGQPFNGVNAGSIETEDLNGDGFKDIFATGAFYSPIPSGGGSLASIYFNNKDASIGEISIENFEIYPNPIQNKAIILSPNEFEMIGNMEIEVIDLLGNSIYNSTFTMNDELVTIDLEHAIPGSYIVKIKSNNKFFSTKFVIPN